MVSIVRRVLFALTVLLAFLAVSSTTMAEERKIVIQKGEEFLAFPKDRVGSLAKYGLSYEDMTAVMKRNPKLVTTTCFNLRDITDAGNGRSAGICDQPIFVANRGATLYLPQSRKSLETQVTNLRESDANTKSAYEYTLGEFTGVSVLAEANAQAADRANEAREDVVKLAAASEANTNYMIFVFGVALIMVIAVFGVIIFKLLSKKELDEEKLMSSLGDKMKNILTTNARTLITHPMREIAVKQAALAQQEKDIATREAGAEAFKMSNEAAHASLVEQQRRLDGDRVVLASQQGAHKATSEAFDQRRKETVAVLDSRDAEILGEKARIAGDRQVLVEAQASLVKAVDQITGAASQIANFAAVRQLVNDRIGSTSAKDPSPASHTASQPANDIHGDGSAGQTAVTPEPTVEVEDERTVEVAPAALLAEHAGPNGSVTDNTTPPEDPTTYERTATSDNVEVTEDNPPSSRHPALPPPSGARQSGTPPWGGEPFRAPPAPIMPRRTKVGGAVVDTVEPRGLLLDSRVEDEETEPRDSLLNCRVEDRGGGMQEHPTVPGMGQFPLSPAHDYPGGLALPPIGAIPPDEVTQAMDRSFLFDGNNSAKAESQPIAVEELPSLLFSPVEGGWVPDEDDKPDSCIICMKPVNKDVQDAHVHVNCMICYPRVDEQPLKGNFLDHVRLFHPDLLAAVEERLAETSEKAPIDEPLADNG